MFDVFVSYRHADADDVRPVVQALREAGLRVWLDESNIEDFASIQRGIEDGLGKAKALLAWYSTRYPESLACQWELTRAFTAAQREGEPRRRVLLINPEPANGHIHPIELRDALYRCAPHDAAALQAATKAIAGHTAKLTGTFDDVQERAKPTWYGAAAGDGSNRFFGRLQELWAIHSGLWSAEVPVITNDEARPLVRLVGIGGSGKSLTAEVYGIRFGAAYPGGIFWLRAFGHDTEHPMTNEERSALRDGQLVDFAQAQGVQTSDLSAAQVRAALGGKLGDGAPYLWVVDDLPSTLSWRDAQPWLAPNANGRTLVTTRSEAFDWAGSQVRIDDLDEASALKLLTHARQPETDPERQAARQLAGDLGYHALALELAAVAVRARGFAEFRESLAAPSRDAMDFAASLMQARGQSLPHREKTNLYLSQTLLQSVDALPETAKDFLRLAAQLAPVRIAGALVARVLANADGLDDAAARDAADLAMAAVAAQSLAREPEPGSLLVHTLVSRTMRFRDGDGSRRALLRRSALPGLEAMLGDDIFDVRLHAKLSDPVAHARVALAATISNGAQAEVAEAQLLDALYMYESYHGNFQNARRIADCLIEFSRAQLGPEHAHTLLFMTRLGRMQGVMGDLPGALATHEKVLEISRRTVGESDPQTLTATSDIALTLFKQGKLSPARSLQERVLELRTRVLGEEHPDTLTAMNNLGTTLATQGDFEHARPLQERALELRRKVLGPQHAETLAASGNLAVTLRALGNAAGARKIEEDLVESRGSSVDEDHPENLTAMNNLAATLAAQGDLPKARELMDRVLMLRSRRLGETHPDTLATMNNAAAIMIQQGDHAAALALLERSLALCRQALGPDHPHTLQAAFHLVIALVRAGDASGRVREIVARDLAPLLDQDPANLPVELREIRVRLLPIIASATGKQQPARSWWKRMF